MGIVGHISLLRTMMKMERKKRKRNVIFSRWIILVPLLLDLTQLFLFAPRSKTRPSWAKFFAFRTSLLSFSVTIQPTESPPYLTLKFTLPFITILTNAFVNSDKYIWQFGQILVAICPLFPFVIFGHNSGKQRWKWELISRVKVIGIKTIALLQFWPEG